MLPPPERLPGEPRVRELAPGDRLYRVHPRSYASSAFNPTVEDRLYGGSRFGATVDDKYAFYYATPEFSTALAETVVRDREFPEDGSLRLVPLASVEGRRLSAVRVTRRLRLLSMLTTTDMAAIGLTGWALHRVEGYHATRDLAHRLRRKVLWADGLIWQSDHDIPRSSVVLFGDRCGHDGPGPALAQDDTFAPVDLDSPAGMKWVDEEMRDYQVTLRRPPGP